MTKSKHRPDQRQRFIDTARAVGADESGEAFERAFGKIAPPKKPGDEAPERRENKQGGGAPKR